MCEVLRLYLKDGREQLIRINTVRSSTQLQNKDNSIMNYFYSIMCQIMAAYLILHTVTMPVYSMNIHFISHPHQVPVHLISHLHVQPIQVAINVTVNSWNQAEKKKKKIMYVFIYLILIYFGWDMMGSFVWNSRLNVLSDEPKPIIKQNVNIANRAKPEVNY